MKKLVSLAIVGLTITSLVGCNRGWPSCFCNNDSYDVVSDDCCDPCETSNYYGSTPGTIEMLPPSTPTTVSPLPTPGPDAST